MQGQRWQTSLVELYIFLCSGRGIMDSLRTLQTDILQYYVAEKAIARGFSVSAAQYSIVFSKLLLK